MPFDVSAFVATIDSGTVAPVANFEVLVFGPIADQFGSNYDLSFRCQAVNWPGRRLETIPFSSYGLPREFISNQLLQQVNCEFICSEDFREKTFFQRWQDLGIGSARRASGYQRGMFDIGYYDNYVGTVEIYQYNPNGDLTFMCRLLEAYPVEVSTLNANWQTQDFHRLGVTFQYYLFSDDPQPVNPDNNEG